MTTLKEAAAQAKEALQAVLHDCDDLDMVESNQPGRDKGPWEMAMEAIAKLDAAIAQPESEPVAWRFIDDEDGGHISYSGNEPTQAQKDYLAKWNRPAWMPLYAAPVQPARKVDAPASGEREALVALLRNIAADLNTGKQVWMTATLASSAADMLKADVQPDYVPLTDSEIKAIQYSNPAFMTCSCPAFARAIEQAVRGKT